MTSTKALPPQDKTASFSEKAFTWFKHHGWKFAVVTIPACIFIPLPLVLWGASSDQITAGKEPLPIPIQQQEIARIDPTWLEDEEYCAKEGRTIEDCYQQMRLRLVNLNPESGELGLIPSYIAKEGLRYRATASTFTRSPDYKNCYKQSDEVCLQSFSDNIRTRLENANSNTDYIAGLSQYLGLADTRFGNLPTRTTPDKHLTLRVIEKFESDLALYYGQANAAARQGHGNRYEYKD